MKKLFHFESSRARYICDAAIVWCFDNRFDLAFHKFLRKSGVIFTDPIKIAGGAKSLASPANPSDREFVLDQIRASIQLHGTKRVILMAHSDCGAYGGLETFGDVEKERQHHREELLRAIDVLNREIPGLQIDGYFVDFEGVWEPDLTRHPRELPAGRSPYRDF